MELYQDDINNLILVRKNDIIYYYIKTAENDSIGLKLKELNESVVIKGCTNQYRNIYEAFTKGFIGMNDIIRKINSIRVTTLEDVEKVIKDVKIILK